MTPDKLPLSALLSQTLVAFTIECDNEAEHRQPHHTTDFGGSELEPTAKTPWLTSFVMYFNCVKHIPDAGITAGELERLVRTGTNLGGMRRWGYIKIDPKPLNSGGKGIKPSSVLTLKRAGKFARDLYPALIAEIEKRWQDRFGAGVLDELRQALEAVVTRLGPDLPDCLPILGYGLTCNGRCAGGPEIGKPGRTDTASLGLYSLISKPLLAFALAYEEQSPVALAIAANIMRVLDADGVLAKEVPMRAGVSKEAVAIAEGWLVKQRYVDVDGKGVGRVLRLTSKGEAAQKNYDALVGRIEDQWRADAGTDAIDRLRVALDPLVGAGDSTSPLFQCLVPYPENWRAKLPKPSTLPHFPMVLHRGGYPDGA